MKDLATTLPSASTEQLVSERRPTHVRWVFPRDHALPLAQRTVVGRNETCAMVLPGTEISRDHSAITVDGAVVSIMDLNSRNGTFVNGVRCQSARVETGAVIRCGEWVGVLIASPPGANVDPSLFEELAPGLFGGHTLRRALEPAKKVGPAVHVIVEGETGTGKEGAANAVHRWGGKSGKPVAVNCAAIPESLADAELFGHASGAFTGATRKSEGLFVAASGGTLFLDEILELSPAVQAKLLRAIDQKVIRPLGESRDIEVNVRVIAAAQASLPKAVTDGRFRSDLFARLNGLTLSLPPLRQRREDIVPLFWHFLREQARMPSLRIEAKVAEILCTYDWPRNVRELQVVALQMAQLHGDGGLLLKAHFPETMWPRGTEGRAQAHGSAVPSALSGDPSRPTVGRARKSTGDPVEFEKLVAALGVHPTVAQAAAAIGITLQRANRLLAAHPEFSREKRGR